jgi:hypothetical protein
MATKNPNPTVLVLRSLRSVLRTAAENPPSLNLALSVSEGEKARYLEGRRDGLLKAIAEITELLGGE